MIKKKNNTKNKRIFTIEFPINFNRNLKSGELSNADELSKVPNDTIFSKHESLTIISTIIFEIKLYFVNSSTLRIRFAIENLIKSKQVKNIKCTCIRVNEVT